jgi:hypothetical protein
MKVRHRTHVPGTSKTKYNPFMGDLLRAYRYKRKRKNKIAYKSKKYNLQHGRYAGKQ